MSIVYYRKYRPQKISDLDSEELRKTLFSILKDVNKNADSDKQSKSVPHAFIFTGPKGLGKTSTARIVSKIVNCLNLKNGEPDNTCVQCLSITNGSNIDVLEIDGASNRGIDEIRELRERVNLAPSTAKKKVYIIDEVHMLTNEAFNALLKTIEEPPQHVMFIFCTTEPQKVPATIMSRCFHIPFKLASTNEIVHSLQRVAAGESLDIEEDALHTIASVSDGGFRDATKILEELVALSEGKKITKILVEDRYHVSDADLLASELLNALSLKKLPLAFKVTKQITDSGIDTKFFITKILEKLHQSLLANVGVQTDLKVSDFSFTIQEIQVLSELFNTAYQETKFAVIPQMPIELGIIRYISENTQDTQQSADRNGNINNMDTMLKKQRQMQVKAMLDKPAIKTQFNTKDPVKVVHQHDINAKQDELTSLHENIIYKVKPYNHSVAGILRGSLIKELNDTNIIFETAYKFHKERLEEKRTCEIIEQVVKEITGKKLKVSVNLKK